MDLNCGHFEWKLNFRQSILFCVSCSTIWQYWTHLLTFVFSQTFMILSNNCMPFKYKTFSNIVNEPFESSSILCSMFTNCGTVFFFLLFIPTKIERCFFCLLCVSWCLNFSPCLAVRTIVWEDRTHKKPNAIESSVDYNVERRHARQDVDLGDISCAADNMQNVIDERSFGSMACVPYTTSKN